MRHPSPAQQAVAQLRARCASRPANDVLGEIFAIDTPKSVRAELEQLRASYDVVNLAARGRPEWDLHYLEWKRFYEQTKDIGWFNNISGGTINQIRDRRRQLEQWKRHLADKGIRVGEPERKETDTGTGVADLVKWGLAALVAVNLFQVVRR